MQRSYIILQKKLSKYLILNRFYKSFKIEPVSPLVFLCIITYPNQKEYLIVFNTCNFLEFKSTGWRDITVSTISIDSPFSRFNQSKLIDPLKRVIHPSKRVNRVNQGSHNTVKLTFLCRFVTVPSPLFRTPSL